MTHYAKLPTVRSPYHPCFSNDEQIILQEVFQTSSDQLEPERMTESSEQPNPSSEKGCIRVVLTAKWIILMQHSPVHTTQEQAGKILRVFPVDFTSTFQIIWHPYKGIKENPIGIKFSPLRSTDNLIAALENFSLFHSDFTVIQSWRRQLRLRMFETGFNKQYKPAMKIGKGTSASVYLTVSLEENRSVAVKSFNRKEIDECPNKIKGLIAQITLMKVCAECPFVSKILGAFVSDTNYYIVMELVEGGQLGFKLQSRTVFSSKEIKTVLYCVLSALNQFQSKNIIHRDIKPENIIYKSNKSLEVQVVDFGLACYATDRPYLYYRCGTPGYIAPEILRNKTGKKLESLCDVFSLGLIFHHLLLGKSIFQGKAYHEVLAENVKCEFDLQHPKYSVFTRATVDLLKKMLDINPYTRISAEEALEHPFFSEEDVKRNTLQAIQVREIIRKATLVRDISEESEDSKEDRRHFMHSPQREHGFSKQKSIPIKSVRLSPQPRDFGSRITGLRG